MPVADAPAYRFAAVGLLERDEQLTAMAALFDDVGRGGRLVLIAGEAGAGKSALVSEFTARHLSGQRVLVGNCDDLFAPRPLGPLADIARTVGGPLAGAIASGDQAAAFEAVLTELTASPAPVVVLEDLQWADEATLDLVRFVARRLESLSCLILATHRTELATDHPLRRVVGSLVGPRITRVEVPPLSIAAVRTLTENTAFDAETLHARTGGNPFFVVELLEEDAGTLPATVRDAILARAALLAGPARDALDAAAVLGRASDVELIEIVGDCGIEAIDECVQAGLLAGDHLRQSFRHDLTRDAIDAALTPLRRRQLHARALDALGPDADLVRLAHHAIAAGDSERVIDFAGRAAAHCVGLGAFREAAALYSSALEHAQAPDERRAALLEGRALACERVEQLDEAIKAGEELVQHFARVGDERVLGSWESWLGGVYRVAGRADDAWTILGLAVARLEPLGDSPEMARALGLLGQHQMVSSHSEDAVVTTNRAIAMAEQFGAEEIVVHAMDSQGTALCCLGDESGLDVLNEALDRAKRASVHHEVTRTSVNLAEALLFRYRPADALGPLDRGLAVATERELRFNRNGLLNARARALFLLGRWNEAVADVDIVLAEPDLSDANRSGALLQLGSIRARRGDPNARDLLDDALALAAPYDEMQLLFPIIAARAEAAWLAGDVEAARREVQTGLPRYDGHPEPWYVNELALWCHRTGIAWKPAEPLLEPFRLMLEGDAKAAAAAWSARECVYEAADALGDSDDVADLRAALDTLTELGARPRAHQVARSLRERGVRDLPRGPRATTRKNPAGLTAREVEVAALIARGLANNEIADRLVLSAKTVDHHVSSILSKLGVTTRRHVGKAAADRGVELFCAAQDGEGTRPT